MFKLALIHIRRYLKNPILLIMMGPIPLVMTLGSLLLSGGDNFDTSSNTAFILKNEGSYETTLVESLQLNENQIYIQDETEAINQLKANELAGVFIIPETFSDDLANGKKPVIEVIKTVEGAGTAETELKVEEVINGWLKDYHGLTQTNPVKTTIEYVEAPADMRFTLFISMVIYFMFIAVTTLAKDVSQLKQQKILHRALSTANKDIQIFGGLVLAMCLIQGICFTIVYYLGMFLLGTSIPNPVLPIVLMFSMSFVASSLVIFVTRIIKNPAMIELSIIMYSLVGFIISMLSISLFDIGLDANIITNIAKIFPIYWAFDTALNFQMWPNIFIILLFGLAFLSAGSFKLKNFIQN